MNEPSLRTDWLASFVCFAEHLNFTRAAAALHISQPALHVQIAKLSEDLGTPLYSRRGRSLELTREGTKVLAFARETEERSRSFRAQLGGTSVNEPVILCAGEGAYLYLLSEAIRAYSKRAAARLQLLTRDRSGTIDAIQSGEAHLGVASLDAVPDGIALQTLCDVEQVIVVPRAHAIAKKRVAHLADLEGAALVVPPAGRPHRTMISRALQAAGVSWHPAAEASGWELIVHFAALGLGLAIVNGFCRIPHGMVARPLRGLPPVRYSLLTRAGAVHGEEALRMKRLIAEKTTQRHSGL